MNIGIIGGADGPTAVLVAAHFGLDWLVFLCTVLLAGIVIFRILRRRKK